MLLETLIATTATKPTGVPSVLSFDLDRSTIASHENNNDSTSVTITLLDPNAQEDSSVAPTHEQGLVHGGDTRAGTSGSELLEAPADSMLTQQSSLATKSFQTLLKPLPRRKQTSLERKLSSLTFAETSLSRRDRSQALQAAEVLSCSNGGEGGNGGDAANNSKLSVCSDDKTELFQRLGPFEARKAVAAAKLRSELISISAKELRMLHFLATVDHGKERPDVACSVETKNFRLQWLLNPAARCQRSAKPATPANSATRGDRQEGASQAQDCGASAHEASETVRALDDTAECCHRSPRMQKMGRDGTEVAQLNLLTLPTDILLHDRKPPSENRTALLDSPRSVLTCLRNGVQPMELQSIPLDAAILAYASKGYSRDMIVKRHAFEESFRKQKLQALQDDYGRLCDIISLVDICTFFEFMALNDGLQAPDIVEVASPNPGASRMEVAVSGDTTIFEAVRKIEEKAAQDRKRLTTVLQHEIDNTKLRAETFAKQQAANAAKTRAHEREVRQREDERQQAAAARKSAAEAKAKRRAELVECASLKRLEEVAARQARAVEAERVAEEALDARAAQRRERHRAKQEAQLLRLHQAEQHIAKIDESRRERFAEKQRLRDVLLQQKAFDQACKREEGAAANERLAQRRQEIVERGETIMADKQRRAKEQSEKVEARLRRFAEAKAHDLQFKRLVDLRNALNREEVFEANEARTKEAIAAIVQRREEHDASFDAFEAQQAEKRAAIRERELQVMLLKEEDQSRHDQKHAYQLLLAAAECTRKVAKSKQLEDARSVQQSVLETERSSMNLLREEALEDSALRMVRLERRHYLEIFRETSPGEAVTLRGPNLRALSRMRQTRSGDGCELSTLFRNTLSGQPSAMHDLSQVSTVRPSTALDQSLPAL